MGSIEANSGSCNLKHRLATSLFSDTHPQAKTQAPEKIEVRKGGGGGEK